MALANILGMVKARLPFLPTDNSMDAVIEQFITEQFYFLQTYTGLSNTDVEDEIKYTGLQKMLVAELVCVELLQKQTLAAVGGTNGQVGTAGQRIKKGKADVVEAEFEYGKAGDGTFLGASASELIMSHAKKACQYASTLNYQLAMCAQLGFCVPYDTPGFIFIENVNDCSCG